MKMVKKITVKTVVGGPPAIREKLREMKDGESAIVMRVFGVASSVKRGVSTLPDGTQSEYAKLGGRFRAEPLVGAHVGERFAAGTCILPDVAQDEIVGQIESGDVQAVEFALDITVNVDDSAATGYVYGATPLVKPAEDESLSRLEAAVAGQLEAPAASAKGSKAASK